MGELNKSPVLMVRLGLTRTETGVATLRFHVENTDECTENKLFGLYGIYDVPVKKTKYILTLLDSSSCGDIPENCRVLSNPQDATSTTQMVCSETCNLQTCASYARAQPIKRSVFDSVSFL